jgi:hypothetical protein
MLVILLPDHIATPAKNMTCQLIMILFNSKDFNFLHKVDPSMVSGIISQPDCACCSPGKICEQRFDSNLQRMRLFANVVFVTFVQDQVHMIVHEDNAARSYLQYDVVLPTPVA